MYMPKYDGIISKDTIIKYQEMRIDDPIISETKIDEMDVQSEEKMSNVEPYRHPHY
jgi:hypothetical protein